MRTDGIHAWPVGTRPATRWDVTDHRLRTVGHVVAMQRRDTGVTVYVIEGDDDGYHETLNDAVGAIARMVVSR